MDRVRLLAVSPLLMFGLACTPASQSKGPGKHYHLTGKVLSLNAKDQTASIDASAIPDYMEAMTMTYPIASKAEFESLHSGERIEATVNVYESGDYSLSSIRQMVNAK